MIRPEELSKDIPVTILYKWLEEQAESDLTDSLAALSYLPKSSNSILTEKAVAAVAIHNNKTSLWDSQGLTNTCLIMNSIPASADYIASVDPCLMAYAVWELVEDTPDLVVGPNAIRAMEAAVDGAGYVYPPSELAVLEDYFLTTYEASKKAKEIYEKCKEYPEVKDQLKHLDKATLGMNQRDRLFYKYQISRILSADNYVERMKEVYSDWMKRFRGTTQV